MIAVGSRVRALYPNTSWGEGVVVDADTNASVVSERGRRMKRKPYVVRRDDGVVGHFHEGQIAVVLSLADLEAALADERHLGWGYATTRDVIESDAVRGRLDAAVVDVANELGLDREQLFAWVNSKHGRWLVDVCTVATS